MCVCVRKWHSDCERICTDTHVYSRAYYANNHAMRCVRRLHRLLNLVPVCVRVLWLLALHSYLPSFVAVKIHSIAVVAAAAAAVANSHTHTHTGHPSRSHTHTHVRDVRAPHINNRVLLLITTCIHVAHRIHMHDITICTQDWHDIPSNKQMLRHNVECQPCCFRLIVVVVAVAKKNYKQREKQKTQHSTVQRLSTKYFGVDVCMQLPFGIH